MSAAMDALNRRRTPAEIEQMAALKAARARMAEAASRGEKARQKAAMNERLDRLARAIKLAAERQRLRDMADRVVTDPIAMRLADEVAKPRATVIPTKGTIGRAHFEAMAARVATAYGVTVPEMLGQSRTYDYAAARAHLVALVAMECPRLSIAAIGRAMGRDHTTIIHSLRNFNAAFGTNIRNTRHSPGRKRQVTMKFRRLEDGA